MRKMALAVLFLATLPLTVRAQAPAAADPLAAADAAFARDKTADALVLYNTALSQNPDNVHALVRSAMLLSWKKEWNEAIRRYEKALTIDPQNATARLERAKVLSWSRQYSKALVAFRELAAADPSNVNAQLGVARVLSWSGRQPAARAEYMKILGRTPNSVEATIGVAQTYAWSGEEANARVWYGKALQTDATHRGAILGMAYLDLEGGDRFEASRKATQLETRFPNDEEVRTLRGAVNRAASPLVRVSYDHTDDTDKNEVQSYAVEAVFGLRRRADLTFGYSRYDLTNSSNLQGSIQSGFAQLFTRPTASQRLILRAGVDKLERTNGSSRNEPIGRVTYALGAGSKFETTLIAERRNFRYSTTSLDRGIRIDSYSVAFQAKPASSLRLTASGGRWNLSDDNRRTGANAGVSWRWPVSGVRVDTGYSFQYFDFDRNLDNGYFDPQGFTSNALSLDLHKDFRTVYAHASVERGIQSFELNGLDTDDDQYMTWGGVLGIRFSPQVSLELSALKSDSAVQNPSGFESEQYSARLRIQTGQ